MDKNDNDTPLLQDNDDAPLDGVPVNDAPPEDGSELEEADDARPDAEDAGSVPLQDDDAAPEPIQAASQPSPPADENTPPPEAGVADVPDDGQVPPANSSSPLLQEHSDVPPRDNRALSSAPIKASSSGNDALHEPQSSTLPLILAGVAIIAAFAVGLIGGFLGRPLVLQDVPVQVAVTVIPPENPQPVAQAPGTTNQDTSSTTAQSDNDQTTSPAGSGAVVPGEPTPTIMDFLLTDARHFQGDDEAAVTLIEFSDFK